MALEPKKMKVAELRTALEERGLETTGLKAELIQRLETALDEEEFGVAEPATVLDENLAPVDDEENVEHGHKPINGTASKTVSISKPGPQQSARRGVISLSGKDGDAGHKSTVAVLSPTSGNEAASKTPELIRTLTPKGASAAETTAKVVNELSVEERRQKRAERFGIPPSIDDLKAKRAARFGLPVKKRGGQGTPLTPEEIERKKKRAMRFGVMDADLEKEKSEKRAERFGLKKSKEEITAEKEKLERRKARFASSGK